jgi:hypothetical protein
MNPSAYETIPAFILSSPGLCALKMEAVFSTEIHVPTYQPTWYYNPAKHYLVHKECAKHCKKHQSR